MERRFSIDNYSAPGSHYSLAFNTEFMINWAKEQVEIFLENLENYLDGYNIDYKIILCYSGMSGISHATHIATEFYKKRIKVFHLYVRKQGEKSNGRSIEDSISFNTLEEKCIFIFVDDFIFEGKTLNHVMSSIGYSYPINNNSKIYLMLTRESSILEEKPFIDFHETIKLLSQ